MGCVLGKRATGGRTARRKRDPESAAVTVQNDVEELKIKEAPAPAADAGRWSVPVPEFRLRIGADAAGAEAWPPWLVAVAGDEIKSWKPRRANTFEKLDKVKTLVVLY